MEEYRKKCCLALLLDEQSESEDILHALAETPYHTVIWKSNSSINPNEMLLPEGPMPEVLNTVFEDGFSRGFRKVVILKPTTEINPALLDEAFLSLKLLECCIGLKDNGDFYLLGMNDFRPEILSFIPPDHVAVSKKIIRRIGDQKLALYKTPTLQSE